MSRYYPNKFLHYKSIDIDTKRLIERVDTFVQDSHQLLLNHLNVIKHGHYSLYTGSVGIAMTLHRINGILNPKFRHDFTRLIDLDIKVHSVGEGSFEMVGFASDEISAQLYQFLKQGRVYDMIPLLYKNKFSAAELLTGKAGLALMVQYFADKGLRLANPNLVEEIIGSIPLEDFPWSWHKKVYYGAAHGTAGILHAMNRILGDTSPGKKAEYVDYVIENAYFSSGNFRSSESSDKDELVQWCHGAPGIVPLLLDNVSHPSCQEVLKPALDDIWRRGILKKGSNICHGIAGNGYAFLAAYVQLGDKVQLDRAVAFAQEILDIAHNRKSPIGCCDSADHPYSLFEGLAGVVHYLLDLKEVLHMKESGRYLDFPLEYKLFDQLRIF